VEFLGFWEHRNDEERATKQGKPVRAFLNSMKRDVKGAKTFLMLELVNLIILTASQTLALKLPSLGFT
jgi:hypothetical protein